MSNLYRDIQQKQGSFSKGQKRVASFILEHGEQAAFLTAAQLGERSGVSESTAVRFAYALGLNGYPALQKRMQEMVLGKLTSVQRARLADEIPSGDVLGTVISNDINSLRITLERVDPVSLDRAAEAVVSARRVFVLGLRSAEPLAQFLTYYLSFICPNVQDLSRSTQSLKENMLRVEKEDVLFCISFPRYSAGTAETARFAKSRGARLIALTDKMESPIGMLADSVLLAKSDMASFADSLTAPLSLLNAFITVVGQKSKAEGRKHLEELESMWDSENVYWMGGGDEA